MRAPAGAGSISGARPAGTELTDAATPLVARTRPQRQAWLSGGYNGSRIVMVEQAFMQRAVALALEKMRANSGGPFGAVIVRNDTIIAEGWNEVTSNNDPTAHAEIVAIRRACTLLGAFNLPDCDIYTSCE